VSLALGAQDGWRPVALTMPPPHGTSALAGCAADTTAPAFRVGAGGMPAVEAMCGRQTLIRCNVPGLEPLDVDLDQLCRGRQFELVSTERSVVATWAHRVPATVEWRGWRDAVSYLIATRRVDAQTVDPWPLSSELRLLRVVRPESSPITFVIPKADIDAVDVTVAVPPPQHGGELLIALAENERQVPTLVVRGPETRVVGINGAPVVAVSGLPAGDYEVILGSLDVALSAPTTVRVIEGETVEMSSRLPVVAGEYRISGAVTLNGEPLRRRTLWLTHLPTDAVRTVTTDDRGRYAVTVDRDGRYVVRVHEEDFGYASADAVVQLGDNVVDLDLTGGDLDVAFSLQGTAKAGARVTLTLDGPLRLSSALDPAMPTQFTMLPAGTYAIAASIAPDLVSDTARVTIDATGQTQRVLLDLRPQTASLRIPDIPGVRARAGRSILRSPANDGTFDVRQVALGTEIIGRAPGRVPGCVRLAPAVAHVIALGSDTAAITFHFTGAATMRVPTGRVRLSAVDQCAIPLEEFEWRRVPDGFEILNFPRGVPVTFELDRLTMEVVAPSGPVVVK
jgi:hypothetical protein